MDGDYQRYQYGDSDKLRIRVETHRLYSERPDRLRDEVIASMALIPGLRVLDVGCGPGGYHESVWRAGAQVVGLDASAGMVREARANAAAAEQSRRSGWSGQSGWSEHSGQSEPGGHSGWSEPRGWSGHTGQTGQSGQSGWRVHVAQADAQVLPFRDGAFDRVLAAHMLYHVPDRGAALREMRRVLRGVGRVVLATNGAPYLARLERLHREAAASLGYTPTSGDGDRFTLNDVDFVRAVFPLAERHILDNALVFHDPEPVVRYYASGIVDRIRNRPVDSSHRARLLPLVRAGLKAIIKKEGEFRDPKPAGYFVANKTP